MNRVWGKSLLVRFHPFLEATSSNFCFSSDALFRVFVKSAPNLRPLGESCSISGLLIWSWGSCQTWGDGGTCTGHLGRSLDQLGLGEPRPPQGTDRSQSEPESPVREFSRLPPWGTAVVSLPEPLL